MSAPGTPAPEASARSVTPSSAETAAGVDRPLTRPAAHRLRARAADGEALQEGDTVRSTGRVAQVPVGEELVGRMVNAVGQELDGEGPIETSESPPVERVAPGVIYRQRVDTPLQTGMKAIDAMIPDRPWPARADHR